MTDIQKIYLSLLRAALWDRDGDRIAVGTEQLNAVIRLATFQGTGPLVYDQLLKLKDLDIPANVRMQLKQLCVSNMMSQQSMLQKLAKAWNTLEDADIDPVLLKGFGLAQYYPQPYLRQWGDMDIYIGQENYHKACRVLREVFPDAWHQDEEDEDYKHYNFVFDDTMIEAHRVSMTFAHPIDRRYYERQETIYLTKNGPKLELEGLSLTMPEDTFNVFFVFLHAWHHFSGTGMNMKQICDMAVLLHAKRDAIDKQRLKEMLSKLYLMEVWQLMMYILVRHLGVPKNECPFDTEACKNRAELLFEQILIEGSSYRRKEIDDTGASYVKRKCLTFQSRLADSKRVRPFAPKYARHMVISDFVHGIERTLKGK